jgi:O-antigen ligase
LGIITSALFASGSLTGIAAVVAAVIVMAVAYATTRTPRGARRRRSSLAPIAVISIVAVGVLALGTSDLAVVQRITGFREGDTYVVESVESRGDRNALVTSQFDEFLLVGFGFTHETLGVTADVVTADNAAIRNYGVHNMHLALLYQAGLVALVGVILILVTAARQMVGLLRRADPELYVTTLALIGSFVAVNVNAQFQPTAFDRFYWMPVALAGCLWAIRRNELRADLAERGQTARALPPATGGPAGADR